MEVFTEWLGQQETWRIAGMSAGAGAILAGLGFLILGRVLRSGRPSTKGRAAFKLYHHHTLRSARCVWLINELKVKDDFEIIEYDPYTATEEEKTEYTSKVNLHGTVPSLVTPEGHILTESTAICLYLAELYQDLLPPRKEKPNYYNWGVYSVATYDHIIKPLELHIQYEDQRNIEMLKYLTQKHMQLTASLDKFLEGRQYICGSRFTAADIMLGYSLYWSSQVRGGQLLSDYPNVTAYLSCLKKRKHFYPACGTLRENMLQNEDSVAFHYSLLK